MSREKRKLVGHSFLSKREYDSQMADYSASGGWANGDPVLPPMMATPVYEDDFGNRWTETPTSEGISERPFVSPPQPADRGDAQADSLNPKVAMYTGGFVPELGDAAVPGGWAGPLSQSSNPVGGLGPADLGGAAMPKAPAALGGGPLIQDPTKGGWAGGLGGGDDGGLDLGQLMGGMASQLPPEAALSWLGDTATRAMTAAAPGGMLDTTMQALGLTNPMAKGPLGDALGAALQSAGLGDVAGGMLGTLMNRGASGLASQLGSNVVNQALAMAGLGDLPGMGALSGLAGGALGNLAGGALDDIAGGVVGDLLKNGASGAAASLLGGLGGGAGGLADLMTTGGFAGPLGDATGAFDDIMGGCFPGGDSNMADLSELTSGGCFDPNAGAGLDLNALGSKGLDKAVDHMMSEWKVDDESSAAEHIAHKMVSENLADLKSLAKDELLGGKGGGFAGLAKKIKKFFTGEAPGAGQPAIRMGDLDDQANLCITGIANIKFEGQPVARRTDTVAGPTAPAPKPIVIGEPTVISAGMENAFVLAPTAVPSKMAAKGATTILVGGAVVAALQEAAKKEAEAKSNAAPKAPAGPKSTGSGSASEGQEGEGQTPQGEAGSETGGASPDTSGQQVALGGKSATKPEGSESSGPERSRDGFPGDSETPDLSPAEEEKDLNGLDSSSDQELLNDQEGESGPEVESESRSDEGQKESDYDIGEDASRAVDELKRQANEIVEPIVDLGEAAGKGARIWYEDPAEGWESFKRGMGKVGEGISNAAGAAKDGIVNAASAANEKINEWTDDPSKFREDAERAYDATAKAVGDKLEDISQQPLTEAAKGVEYIGGAAALGKKVLRDGIKGGAIGAAKNIDVDTPREIPRPSYVPVDKNGNRLPLPRDRDGQLLPSSNHPHSQIGWREGRNGGYVQTREFGEGGEPIKQVDWTDHGRPKQGHTDPHVHDYIPNETGGSPRHGPARPPRPGELGDE